MAEIILPPQNLTNEILTSLTSKLDKVPEVTEVAVSDDGSSSAAEEVTFVEQGARITTSFVCDHTPVRSELHKKTVHLRQDLQLHLRSVMRTGDDMLIKIREIIEQLDTAVHEKNLAIEELEDVQIKKRQLTLQYETVQKEVVILRTRLLEMSKARDRAEIELEAVKGHLLEKEEQCNELKLESTRLHIQITEITHKLLEYTSRCSEAESRVRIYITEITKLKIEIETLKKELNSLTDLNISLGKELSTARFENKDLKIEIEKIRTELISVRSRLSAISIELVTAKEEVARCIVIRDEAITERDLALKDRDEAVRKAIEAVKARDDAIRSRDQAIYTEKSTHIKWLRDSALLEDCQRSLTSIRKTVEIITVERNTAIHNCENFEHLRDEALENFREADAARHRLQKDIVKHVRERKDAELALQLAQTEVKEITYSKEVLIKEKQIIEVALVTSESEKNSAIAKEAKAYEAFHEADKERDSAVKYAEECEDKFQNCQLVLTDLQGQYAESVKSEKLAIVEAELLTNKLEASRKETTTAITERDNFHKDLKETQESFKTTKTELSNLKTSFDKVKSERDIAYTSITNLNNQYAGPDDKKTDANVQIKNIIFGSVRMTQKKTYDALLDSYLKKTPFKASLANLEDTRVNDGQGDRYLGVFYAVKQKDAWKDQLPIWWKIDEAKVFEPKNIGGSK